MRLHSILCGAGALAMATSISASALAQDYPSKPVRIIVPFSPGGGADLTARTVAAQLTEDLGEQFIIENQPGGGTIIGSDMVAKADPDGYTLLVGSPSFTINASLRDDLSYDTVEDLVPVAQMVTQPLILVVNPDVSAQTFEELLTYAREHPGDLSVGTPGIGSAGHMATELMQMMADVELLHVPYKGTGPALTDLLGGQIDMMFASSVAVQDHLESGTLRPLAASVGKRASTLPDIPTISESGLEGYEAGGWNGLFVPAGTSQEIIETLNSAVNAALEDDEVREVLLQSGAEPAAGSARDFESFVEKEVEKWGDVVRSAGIELEQ